MPLLARYRCAAALLLVTLSLTTVRADPVLEITGPLLWSLDSPRGQVRWLIIHPQKEGPAAPTFVKAGSGWQIASPEVTPAAVYHVEILQQAIGARPWDFTRPAAHMAITPTALERSIRRPLHRSTPYPESFHDALSTWRKENDGAGGKVCQSSVAECLEHLR
jgi:hypothetical protein